MKTLIVLLLSCTSLFAGEKFVPISSGETNFISYGLFCLASDSRSASNAPAGQDMVLVLRNDGAQMIDFTGIASEDFSLRDAKGRRLNMYLRTPPQGMPYSEASVIQLLVTGNGDSPEPWTLHFTSKGKAIIPIDLTITDIRPCKN